MGPKATVAIMGAFFIALMGPSSAADYKQDLNNYSHQSIICGTYYIIVAQCLRNRSDADSISLASRYDTLAQQAVEESYQTAKLAGLSDKAAAARSEIEAQEQMNEIEKSCVNIAVLNLKYGKSCKTFMESRESTLEVITKKMINQEAPAKSRQ